MRVQPTPIPPRTGLDAPGGFPAAEPVETLRDYYRQMALIREFELRAAQMYQAGENRWILPPQPGRGSHRGRPDGGAAATRLPFRDLSRSRICHCPRARARAVSWQSFSARPSGVSGGRGGSMHLFDPHAGAYSGDTASSAARSRRQPERRLRSPTAGSPGPGRGGGDVCADR